MCRTNTNILNNLKDKSLVEQWKYLSEVLAFVKAKEMEVRKAIVSGLGELKIGTNHCGDLVVTKKLNYKVDEGNLNNFAEKLEKEFIDIGSLFKVKHELVLKEYKALTDEQKNIVDNVLTITEGAPTLEIKEQKK